MGSHIAAAIKTSTKLNTLVIDSRADHLPHTLFYADHVINDDYASKAALRAIDIAKPKAVIHCAASSLVGPSVTDPAVYYRNNVTSMIKLLDHMRDKGHNNLVFSSSSSVYGDHSSDPCLETDPLCPVSPYGATKQMGEMLLRDYSTAYGINSIAFRYFNAVGASPTLGLGQEPGATHIIARLMEGLQGDSPFTIYGDDYPTADGTCVRDYVHVADIARAHVMGVVWLLNNPGHHVYNIGSGRGYSVKEIISAVEAVDGRTVNIEIGARRQGDPAVSLAMTTNISRDLGWHPINDIRQIVTDAHAWYNSELFKCMGC